MTASQASQRVVTDRLAIVAQLLEQIRALPLRSPDEFHEDPRNAPAAESCLRRSLEALLDLGRHILAKAYGVGVSEYKEIAVGLGRCQVLSSVDAELLRTLAGYRNRLVHFYHDVAEEELYTMCSERLGDLEQIRGGYLAWMAQNPEKLDQGV
jgi:uncharacterized protein YutE (UPF0331/DUF86 family)